MKHLFFIAGLGNADAGGQSWLVKRWENDSTKIHIFDTQWDSQESFNDKQQRLLNFFDSTEIQAEDKVTFLAVSAGGPLTMSTYGKRSDKINRLLFVSAKLKDAEAIGQSFRKRAVALYETVISSEEVIAQLNDKDKNKMLCLRPISDMTVPVKDMVIPEVRTKKIFGFTHAMGIAVALIFYVNRYL